MSNATDLLAQAKRLEDAVAKQYKSVTQIWGKFQAGVLTDDRLQVSFSS